LIYRYNSIYIYLKYLDLISLSEVTSPCRILLNDNFLQSYRRTTLIQQFSLPEENLERDKFERFKDQIIQRCNDPLLKILILHNLIQTFVNNLIYDLLLGRILW
jgi:hypothetical protein